MEVFLIINWPHFFFFFTKLSCLCLNYIINVFNHEAAESIANLAHLQQPILWQTWMSVQMFVSMHPVDVEIFHWISENSDLLMVLNKKSGNHQSPYDLSSGDHGYLFTILWESIQQLLRYFSLEWWTDWQTNIASPTQIAWLKRAW